MVQAHIPFGNIYRIPGILRFISSKPSMKLNSPGFHSIIIESKTTVRDLHLHNPAVFHDLYCTAPNAIPAKIFTHTWGRNSIGLGSRGKHKEFGVILSVIIRVYDKSEEIGTTKIIPTGKLLGDLCWIVI